jgi:Leucine-rich repeat (LRR) protein
MPPSPSRRRWFRISLRTVLILLTLLCIWLGVKVNQARRQKEAIAALKSIGALIGFHHHYDDQGNLDHRADPPGPAWLRQITGDDFFQRVYSVSGNRVLSGRLEITETTTFTDEHAAHLSAFDDLVWLSIDNSPASDEALSQIGDTDDLVVAQFFNTPVGDKFVRRLTRARQLELLILENTQVTGDGLGRLSNLREVKRLILSNSPIGNDGLRGVSNMTGLTELQLANLPIDDAGMAHLPELSNVTELQLRHLDVTDDGLKNLTTGPALSYLNLTGTKIRGTCLEKFCTPSLRVLQLSDTLTNDDSLRQLDNATGLGRLWLDGTKITNDGLAHLAKVKWLKSIDLRRTDVTDEGLAHLSQMPSLVRIDLTGHKITDDGVAHLAKIPSIHTLDLSGTAITGSGLRHLAKVPTLLELLLSDTNLSREGFEHLTNLPRPPPGESLYLELKGTPLNDSTIGFINGLSVGHLTISKTKITDVGLAKLTNMPRLFNLDLTDTAVTPAGVAALKQRLPSLQHVHTSFDQDPK